MSGKTLKPGSLAYQLLIWSVVLTVVLGACGDAATATPVPIVPTATAVPIPTATPTIAFTSTPVPTPTPTEIPIVLPTATPPNPNLPATAPAYVEPFTQAPTYTPYPTTTPYPTDRPAPTITPYAAPYVVPLSIYQKALVGPYARLDYIPYPNYTTQCIAANYFTLPATPTPLPTATALPGGVSRAITDVTQIAPPPVPAGNIQLNGRDVSTAPDNEWVTQFETRWITNQRLNQYRLPAPTFTPIPTSTPVPTSTPIPTATPLPYNTPDVFTGLTPAPPNTPTDTPAPTNIPATTAPPIVPTWTPSLVDRFQQKGSLTGNFIQSIFISDVTSSLNEYTTDPINFVAMWQVMNDLTLALINVDTPIEVSLRAYEQYLDTTINVILNRSLYDPSLNTTGEQRYAARKIIIGNVPDLRAFRFFAPCFAQDRLKNVQDQYNSIIAKMAAKYPGKVFVADLSNLNWLGNPQWVSVTNGYNLSLGGSNAVADVFGKVFLTLRF